MSLLTAIKLAAKQTPWPSPHNARAGAQYFMFAKARSPACTAAATYYHTTLRSGQECLRRRTGRTAPPI